MQEDPPLIERSIQNLGEILRLVDHVEPALGILVLQCSYEVLLVNRNLLFRFFHLAENFLQAVTGG